MLIPRIQHHSTHNRISRIILLLLSILCLGSGCQAVRSNDSPAAAQAERRIGTVVLLHTNDLHANLLPDENGTGGMANIAAYIKSVKGSRPDVLVLDAGDMSVGKGGKPVPLSYYGMPMFDVMNHCGYDFATLGNHEFDKGANEIFLFRNTAEFPILCSNLVYHGKLIGDSPTALVDVNGLKVGIIGLTTSYYFRSKTVDELPVEATVQKYIDELEPQAHLIVGLTHIGCDKDCELACAVSGLDVIVGGHTHTRLCNAITMSDTIIVQAGEYGEHVGRLELTVDLDTEKILDVRQSLVPIPVPGLDPDSDVLKSIEHWNQKASEIQSVVIGRNPRTLTIPEVTAAVECVWKEDRQTDFAYQNPDGTQSSLPSGEITVADIYKCLPFQDTLVTLKLSREQVLNILPHAHFAENKPLYTLVTNNYIAYEFIDQYELPDENVEWTAIDWRDPVIAYIKEHGNLMVERGER